MSYQTRNKLAIDGYHYIYINHLVIISMALKLQDPGILKYI